MESKIMVDMLKLEIAELKKGFSTAQQTIANHARNALEELKEGNEDAVIEILKAMSGDEE